MADTIKLSTERTINSLTVEGLRALLYYDPCAGVFTRLSTGYAQTDSRYAGRPAGYVNSSGYVLVAVLGMRIRAHRLAWYYMTGAWPTADIDHINRDKADNRWRNLREVTRSENLHNTGLRKDSSSGHRGVCWLNRPKRWLAHGQRDGKRFSRTFKRKEDAVAAVATWRELG